MDLTSFRQSPKNHVCWGAFNLSHCSSPHKSLWFTVRKTTLSRVLGGDKLRIRGDAGDQAQAC